MQASQMSFHGADELHRALAADRRTPVVERRRLRVTPSRGDGVRSDRACGRERRASRSLRARRRRRVRSRTGPRERPSSETTDYLDDDEHDIPSDRTAVIGPAGENEVRFASIMTTEERAFGRGGLGAVLGSKNVKAVTFGGDSAPDLSINATANEIHREAATEDHIMKEQGTVAVMDLANEMDGLPSYYFSERLLRGRRGDQRRGRRGEEVQEGNLLQRAFACKLPTRDEARGVETEGPEFEVAMAFGSNSGVDDIVDVMESNRLCDEYGLDAISAGNTIAAYLAAEDEFGNRELIWDLVDKIAQRDGVGDQLAGIGRIHDDLGVGNWSVKNMDFAAHEGGSSTAKRSRTRSRTAAPTTCTRRSTRWSTPRRGRGGHGARRVRGESREARAARGSDGTQRQRRRLQVLTGLHDARALRTALRRRLRGVARARGCTDRDAGASLQQPARDRRRRRPAPRTRTNCPGLDDASTRTTSFAGGTTTVRCPNRRCRRRGSLSVESGTPGAVELLSFRHPAA